jgi:hypothetical protein
MFKNKNLINAPLSSLLYFEFFIVALLFFISFFTGIQGEVNGNIASVLVGAIIVVIMAVINYRTVPSKLTKYLLLIFMLKVCISFAHFYWIFCPAAGINNASETVFAYFGGDLVAEHGAALHFLDAVQRKGVLYAVFGDYYRAINNPGVGIYYGILYGVFGSYPTVAYSFNAVVMFLSSIIVYHLSILINATPKRAMECGLITMLMPSFFVMCPLYRDQLMLLLITASVYALILFIKKPGLISIFSIVSSVLLLISLRLSYIVLIPIYAAVVFFHLCKKRIWLLTIILPVLGGVTFYLQAYLVTALERKQSMSLVDISGAARLGGGLFGKIVFLLMTPFPWYQIPGPAVLTYQIFSYPQAWFSMALIMYTLSFVIVKNQINNNGIILLGFFGLFFLLALMGSMLHPRYYQIALPLLIPFLARGKRQGVRLAAAGSFSVFLIAHFIYFFF